MSNDMVGQLARWDAARMASTQNFETGSDALHDVFYIECSLPTGLTIAEYRRLRPRRPSLWRRGAAALHIVR